MTAPTPPSMVPERTRRSESGDTLVEVLLAIVILGLASVAILIAFSTSISGSAEHRSIATQDTVLRTAAEEVISEFQQPTGSPYNSCAADGPILFNSPNLPTGYTASTTVNYWNGSQFGALNAATCVANSPQMITITVSLNGGAASPPLNVVVDDPQVKPIPPSGTATQLVFLTSPNGSTCSTTQTAIPAGSAFPCQPVVAIEDANGNIVPDDLAAIQLSISTSTDSNGAALSNCAGSEFGGVVSFTGCEIDTAGTYELTASDQLTTGGLSSGTSSSFTITAGAATQLQFTSMPTGTATAGTTFDSAFGVRPAVTVEDQFGNPITTNTDAITLSITPGTGTSGAALTCTTNPVHAVSGVVTFSGCWINLAGSNYTLTATDGPLSVTSSTNDPITIVAAAANKLIFTTQPSSTATGGTAFGTQPVVAVEDVYGNVVTTNTDGITLAITTGTDTNGAVLSCTSANPLTAVGGVASYVGCSINKASTTSYILKATDGSLTAATSNAITVSVGPVAQLVFTTQPVGNVTEGTAVATEPVVTIEDAGGNVVTSDNSAVSLSIASYTAANGGSVAGALGCTSNPVNATAGVATFLNASCKITGTGGAGTYTLRATQGSSSGTSSPLSIVAGAANKLIFTTQPSSTATGGTAFGTQPVVAVEDTNGNIVTANASAVTLAITSGTGTNGAALSCTSANPLTAVGGVASYVGCSINKAGTPTYTLKATDGSLIAATSNAITVSVGPVAQLIFTTQPVGGVEAAALATEPVVTIEDAGGNVVTSDNSAVSLSIASYTAANGGSTVGTLVCTGNPVNATAGVATFLNANCKITGTGGAGTYSLSATQGSSIGTSSSVSIVAGAPNKLVYTSEPPTIGTAGSALRSFGVTVEDTNGNIETTGTGSTDTITLSLASSPSGAAFNSAPNTYTNVVATNGTATFPGVVLGTAGSYTLRASDTKTGDTGVTTATSTPPTNIDQAAPNQLVYLTSPQSFIAGSGTGFGSGAITVQLQDAYGNPVDETATTGLTFNVQSGVTYVPAYGSTTACTSSTCTIPAGSSTGTFYMIDTTASTDPTTTTAGSFATSPAQTEMAVASTSLPGSVSISAQSGALSPTGTANYTITVSGLPGGTKYVEVVVDGLPTSATSTVLPAAGACVAVTGTSATWSLGVTTNGSSPASTSNFAVVAGRFTNGTCTTLSGDAETNGQLVINPGTASQLAIMSGPVSGTNNGSRTIGPILVQEQDQYGNPVKVGANTTVNLASSSSGGSFASTSNGTATPTVTIGNGSSFTTFYYGDTTAGTPVITASSGSLTSDSQTETT